MTITNCTEPLRVWKREDEDPPTVSDQSDVLQREAEYCHIRLSAWKENTQQIRAELIEVQKEINEIRKHDKVYR